MKKYLLIPLILLCVFTITIGQTNATDFTATDCNGQNHNLFTDLNNGKIVVLVWVMPCSGCISDALSAHDAVQYFSATYPGKVLYYLIDDVGNTNCATLSSWAGINGIGAKTTSFSNVGTPISENDYGGSGMPHVVVIGGTDHKVFLNIKNGANNEKAIQSAITQALNVTATNEMTNELNEVSIYPTIAKDMLTVNYSLLNASIVTYNIIDQQGKILMTNSIPKQAHGKYTMTIDVSNLLNNGLYFFQLRTTGINRLIKFTVIH